LKETLHLKQNESFRKIPAYTILTGAMRVKIVLSHVICTVLDVLLVQRGYTGLTRKIKIAEIICVMFAYF
jgi:hypothetical protein